MGWTLLYWAVEIGNTTVVKTLLDAGANPNFKGDTETVLCRAISRGSVTSVSYLVEAGADVNANCDEMSNLTPLQLATEKRLSAIVEILAAGARR